MSHHRQNHFQHLFHYQLPLHQQPQPQQQQQQQQQQHQQRAALHHHDQFHYNNINNNNNSNNNSEPIVFADPPGVAAQVLQNLGAGVVGGGRYDNDFEDHDDDDDDEDGDDEDHDDDDDDDDDEHVTDDDNASLFMLEAGQAVLDGNSSPPNKTQRNRQNTTTSTRTPQQQQQQQQPRPKKKKIRGPMDSSDIIVRPEDLPPFNDMLYQLLKFRAEHHHCSVPKEHECYLWVIHLRRQYYQQKVKGRKDRRQRGDDSMDHNILTPERLKILESIGFNWVTIKMGLVKLWCEHFNDLVEFRKQHGHCNVTTRYSKILNGWINTQRTNRRKEDQKKNKEKERLIQELGGEKEYELKTLEDAKMKQHVPLSTEERFAKLDSIGFDWQILGPCTDWEVRYQQLVKFKQEFGHCNVSQGYHIKGLVRWVGRHRYEYKCKLRGKPHRLNDERERRLNEIGFDWQIKESPLKWEERYQQLVAFKNQHGHCKVSRLQDKCLAEWVSHQRRYYSKKCRGKDSTLTDERVALLRDIGFEFVMRPKNKRRKRKRGHTGPTDNDGNGGEDDDDDDEYFDYDGNDQDEEEEDNDSDDTDDNTVDTEDEERQKRVKVNKSDSHEKQPPVKWKDRYQQLVAFKNEHGHFSVPKSHDKTLSEWVLHQRRQYSKKIRGDNTTMTDEREALLREIGFEFVLTPGMKKKKRKSNDGANSATTTATTNDDNKDNRDNEGNGEAVNETPLMNNKNGFDPKIILTPIKWEERYQQLVAFKNQHGHFSVPKSHDKTLSEWVYRQRREYSKKVRGKSDHQMTDEKEALLRSIGFEFVMPPGMKKKQKNNSNVILGGNNTTAADDDDDDYDDDYDDDSDSTNDDEQGKLSNNNHDKKIVLSESKLKKVSPKWGGRYRQLVKFKNDHGHFSVPRSYDRSLSEWVFHQRRQYSKKTRGLKNGLSDDKEALLRNIGFQFVMPPGMKKKKKNNEGGGSNSNTTKITIASDNLSKRSSNRKGVELDSKSNDDDSDDHDSDDTDDNSDDSDDEVENNEMV